MHNPILSQSVILHAGKGGIILSFKRDAECQNCCSMPEICPTSRIRKPCATTGLMEYTCPEAYILTSHSITAGIGDLKGAEILTFFDGVKTKKEFIVSTACNCHGVFSAFKR